MNRIEHKVIGETEFKWCGRCKKWVELNYFAKNKAKWDGLQERCAHCRSRHWVNIGKFTRTIVPKEILIKKRRINVIKSHGITVEYFNTMVDVQGNKCAICGSFDWGRPSPNIDHNHNTGKVRGLLCNRCNRTLGFVEDSVEILNKMIDYLQKHE